MARTSSQELFASFASFPTVGGSNILYIATDTNVIYRWDGASYVSVSGGGGGSGDVVGPASATDNAIARYDSTTGKLIQNSSATISDTGLLSTDSATLTTRLNAPEIKATSSSGIDFHNNTGTQVAIFGAGGSTGATLVGNTNIGSASADYHQLAGGTGTITNTAAGSSTDINISLIPKGSGKVLASGGLGVGVSSTTMDFQVNTNKTPTGVTNVLNAQENYTMTNTASGTNAARAFLVTKEVAGTDSATNTGYYFEYQIPNTQVDTINRSTAATFQLENNGSGGASVSAALRGTLNNNATSVMTGTSSAIVGTINNQSTGSIATAVGVSGVVGSFSTGTITTASGMACTVQVGTGAAASNMGTGRGFYNNFVSSALSTTTTYYGLLLEGTVSGTVTNLYGVYQSIATASNYFAGKVGIGQTSPTAYLHLAAGTATASTSPIKLTTGTALATPEDGAIEYHSSHLYFTVGSTRYQLDQQAGFSWGSSITGTTGTGSLLTMGNSYASGGIGQSIVLGNTQTNDTTLMKLDMGTSLTGSVSRGLWIVGQNNSNAIALDINVYRNIGINVSRDNTTTQSVNLVAINNGTGAGASQFVNGIYVLNANATGTNFQNGIRVQNAKVSSAQSGYGVMSAGIYVDSTTAGGTSISAYGGDNVNTSTNGLVNYTLSNTQSGASVIEKIDLGTSSQGHTGILIHAYNASVSSKAININQSTTGTGYGIYMQGATNNTGTFGFFNNGSTDNYLFRSFSSSTGTLFGQILNGELLMQSASLSNRTAEFMYSHSSRINEAASGTVADNYNAHYFKRTNRQQTAGGTMTAAGSVLKLENIATQIAGNLTDTVDVLLLDQDTDSTGNIINARAGGTTKFAISATGALTTTPLTDGAVGFLNIPQNSKSAAYTTVAADSGKHIYHPSADTTARTWTIDSNANVAYPIGTALTFVNDTSAGVITIAITSDTLVLAGAGTTGSRTLAANGVATAIKVASTRWIINGTGLT